MSISNENITQDQHAERRRIRVATLLFSAATLLSRVAGLLREIITAAIFGATTTYSAFIVANQIPNLLRSLVADSALSAAFVPVFTELNERGEKERAWRVASGVCTVIVAVLGPITVLAMVAAPWIVRPFVDATFSAEDVELAIGLTRLLMPIVLILALSGVIVGILNAHDRFGLAAIAPVAWNATILLSLVIAAWFAAPDQRIWIYAGGTVAGTLVQAILPAPHLQGLGGRLRLTLRGFSDPKLREVFLHMLPITLSLGLINLQQLLSAVFAANVDAGLLVRGLEAGAGPSLLDKAFRIYMLPQGIFSVAVTTVIFPVLARMATRNDRTGFASTVDNGLRQILILLVPSSVFLAVFAQPVTRILYERGAFDAAQTQATALALIAFSVGLTFNGLSLLLIRSFFSLRSPWIPTLISVVTLAVNVVVAAATFRSGGVFAIALATSVANIVGVLLLYLLLRPLTSGLATARTIAVAVGTLFSAFLAVGAAYGAHLLFVAWLGTSIWVTLSGVFGGIAIAAPIYLLLGTRLNVIPRGFIRQLRRRSS